MHIRGMGIAQIDCMRRSILPLIPLLLATLSSGPALADQSVTRQSDRTSATAVGFRVGGWGFRNTHPDSDGAWDDCRMNGLGVFGERHLTNALFVEAGGDVYFTDPGTFTSQSPGMDRVSGLLTVAGGARSPRFKRMAGTIQAGVGVEHTRVKLPQMVSDGHHAASSGTFTLPLGFVGFGGDVQISGSLRFGVSFRTLVMGHFEHHEVNAAPKNEHDIAAQVQFGLSNGI